VSGTALSTEAFGLTDVGRKRQHNEDAMLVDQALGLYIVADGMGGHAAGEVASARATEVVKQHIQANKNILKDLGKDPTQANRAAAAALVEVAVQRACADIYRQATSDATKRGMGTTFVCLVVAGNRGVIGHVGDSRVYLVRGGQCHRLTAGDTFLLCSDGLHGYLADDEVAPLVASVASGDLPKRFVDLANERGGKDNITAVVLKVAGDGAAVSEETAEAQSRMEALRKIPLFRHLTYKEQTAVLSIATTRTFPAGREIVIEGQPGEELFVVIRGRVAIEKSGVEIAELRAGGHFGEMGLIDNAPRSATVRATEPTRVMVIARQDLMNLMKREAILAVKMLWSFVQVLSDRLRATNSELSEARQELAVAHAVQPFAEE
jgi:serine/threonine protein phosphatase PrpC